MSGRRLECHVIVVCIWRSFSERGILRSAVAACTSSVSFSLWMMPKSRSSFSKATESFLSQFTAIVSTSTLELESSGDSVSPENFDRN